MTYFENGWRININGNWEKWSSYFTRSIKVIILSILYLFYHINLFIIMLIVVFHHLEWSKKNWKWKMHWFILIRLVILILYWFYLNYNLYLYLINRLKLSLQRSHIFTMTFLKLWKTSKLKGIIKLLFLQSIIMK